MRHCPSENLLLENASQTIAGGDNASENEVRISLQGDLSELTARAGYLIPLKLTTSSSDAVVSESRGVVYVRIDVENNVIRDIDSADDMVGFPAGGSSAWTADCGDAANLFDGNNGTAVSGLSSSGNVIIVDMKQTQMVTGLHLYTYGIGNVSIAYSLDGETWDTAGTVADGESVYNGSTWSAGDYYVALADYVEARYLQLSFDFTGWSQNLYEMEGLPDREHRSDDLCAVRRRQCPDGYADAPYGGRCHLGCERGVQRADHHHVAFGLLGGC